MVPSFTDIIRSPGEVELSRKQEKRKVEWVWTSPAARYIKINVDGSYLGGSRKGSMVGFSVTWGFHAELLAFRVEILIAAASRWSLTHSFLFGLDSNSVASWVSNPSSIP